MTLGGSKPALAPEVAQAALGFWAEKEDLQMPYQAPKDPLDLQCRQVAAELAVRELVEIKAYMSGDRESAHLAADRVLTTLLCALDLDDVVEAWEEVEKWYA